MPKNRIEAFADGIFAFAATLLILNIAVDQTHALGPQLLRIWPSYAAYAISFITIGIIGANHHQVMHQIAHVDRFFLMVTVLFLMFIAFIPFPTRLLASDIQTSDAEAAALVYGITLTGTAVLFQRVVAIRGAGTAAVALGRRQPGRRGNQPELRVRAVELRDRNARRADQPADQRRHVCRDRGFLHSRELGLRPAVQLGHPR